MFHAPLTGPQIRALVKGLAGPPAAEWPRGTLGQWLLEQGLGAVELHGIYRFQAVRSEQAPPARSPEQILRLLVDLASESWDHLAAGRVLNPLPIRRAVVEALESGIEAPAFWLGFPDCPPHAAHAVEVAMVALLVGKAAGFSAAVLPGPRHRRAGPRRRLPGAVGRGGARRRWRATPSRGRAWCCGSAASPRPSCGGCAACWSTTATRPIPPARPRPSARCCGWRRTTPTSSGSTGPR